MSHKTPLQLVTDEHGGKEKLVDKILGSVEADGEEDKTDLKRRLLGASNKKLLRLLRNAQALKEKYGSKEKLVGTVAGALGRVKDSDFVKRLDGYTQGRLLDMARTMVPGATGEATPASKSAAAPKPRPPAAAKAAKPAAKPAAPKAGAKAKGKAAKPAAKKKAAAAKKAGAKKGKKK